ncbi:diacylglycerol O-acyltransferase 2-like isoform X2 [Haemaphysalis longicornis]
MRVLGVQFAPLNLPLKRRMETAAVLFITASFFVGGLFWTVVYAYLLFCTRFYWLALIYAAWYVYDWRTPKLGGRSSTRVRSWWIWNNIREYFPARLIKTADLDPGRNYILGYHPHGIMCMGAIANFVSKTSGGGLLFPGIRICALSLNLNFLFPFHREFMLWYGMCSADRESLQYILTKKGTGNAVLIAIGGAQESLDAHKDSSVITLTLMKRKGFVRNAIKCGPGSRVLVRRERHLPPAEKPAGLHFATTAGEAKEHRRLFASHLLRPRNFPVHLGVHAFPKQDHHRRWQTNPRRQEGRPHRRGSGPVARRIRRLIAAAL